MPSSVTAVGMVDESALAINAWAAASQGEAAASPPGACRLCMARDRLGSSGLPGMPRAFEPWQLAHSTGREPIRLVSSSLSCSVRMLVSTFPVRIPSCMPSAWQVSQRISVETGATVVVSASTCAGGAVPGDQLGHLIGIPILRDQVAARCPGTASVEHPRWRSDRPPRCASGRPVWRRSGRRWAPGRRRRAAWRIARNRSCRPSRCCR